MLVVGCGVMGNYDRLVHAASGQYGLVSRAQITAAGYTESAYRHMIKQCRLVRVRRQVFRLPGSRDDWNGSVMAACLAAPAVLASHRSATRLWGMLSTDVNIDVTIRFPGRLLLDDVKVHRSRDLTAVDWSWVDGIPVTSPVRTLCDAGLIFPEHEVRRMLDHSLSSGLVSRGDMWKFRIRVGRQGRNGCGVLGRILESLPPVADRLESGLEVARARVIDAHDLPEPSYQHAVVVNGNRYRVDAAYPEARLFLEVDGASVHSSSTQIAADGGRQNDLVTAGWKPLRFTWSDLNERPAAIARLIRTNLGFCAP